MSVSDLHGPRCTCSSCWHAETRPVAERSKCATCCWFQAAIDAPASQAVCWRYGGAQLYRRDGCNMFAASKDQAR